MLVLLHQVVSYKKESEFQRFVTTTNPSGKILDFFREVVIDSKIYKVTLIYMTKFTYEFMIPLPKLVIHIYIYTYEVYWIKN